MPPQKQSLDDRQKKTRHRHSPEQISALNELYEQDEHPPLHLRTALAERIGLEIKTVNAWFVNKRAAIKKRGLRNNGPGVELPPISTLMAAIPLSPEASHQQDGDDSVEDEYQYPDTLPSIAPPANGTFNTPNGVENRGKEHYFPETNTTLRRMRMRPSETQTAELRQLFATTSHPTKEQREQLAEKIGMPYQTVTNWFQNQRSHGKRRQEEQEFETRNVRSGSRSSSKAGMSVPTALPPPSTHPSLGLPPASSHPSLGLSIPSQTSRASSSSPSASSSLSSRRSSARRSSTPYNTLAIVSRRPRRSRPETYQLEALKALYKKTPMPTIEQRTALAVDIDMDVGKVTNWFRNLRQTARKRAMQNDETESSRSGSPDSVSSHGGQDDEDDSYMQGQSDESEDEYDEVVTPPQATSPSPPLQSMHVDNAEEKATASARFPAINYEDALLLLSFRRQEVH